MPKVKDGSYRGESAARGKRVQKKPDGRDAPMPEFQPEEVRPGTNAYKTMQKRRNTLKRIVVFNSRLSAWFRQHASNPYIATNVCNYIGVKLGTISRHVLGIQPMSLMNAYRLSKFTEIPMERLVEEYWWAKSMREKGITGKEIKDIREIEPKGRDGHEQDK